MTPHSLTTRVRRQSGRRIAAASSKVRRSGSRPSIRHSANASGTQPRVSAAHDVAQPVGFAPRRILGPKLIGSSATVRAA
jgi:hypothetical protein